MIGIIGYGVYDSRPPPAADADEDLFTLSLAAAERCLAEARIDPVRIGCCLVGTGSHAADGPVSPLISAALGAHEGCHTADLHAGWAGGTAAIDAASAYVKSKTVDVGLAVAAECRRRNGAATRARGSDAAAAMLLGRREEELIATIEATRLSRARPLSGAARRAGPVANPALAPHREWETALLSPVRRLLAQTHQRPGEFAHVVLPNLGPQATRELGHALGFSDRQMDTSATALSMGDAGSAAILFGLAAAFDRAEPNELILACDFTAGVGTTVMALRATDRVTRRPAAVDGSGSRT